MKQVAIVGAGAAGLAAARHVRQQRPDLAVTVYERGHVPGGRVASRRRNGYVFDHGAQNIKAHTPAIEHLLTRELPAGGLCLLQEPVWVFDAAGTIAAGDPTLNAEPKWYYNDGNDQLGRLLAEGLDIRYGAPVARLVRATPDRLALLDPAGHSLGQATHVLLTPPAPQTAAIVAQSEIATTDRALLLAELERATYRPCISVTCAFDRRITRPFYALVNIDRAHPIAWLALEHTKGPRRCRPDHSLLIAQMGAVWSEAHWNVPAEALGAQAMQLAGDLLGEAPGEPLWYDIERWPAALPDSAADFAVLNQATEALFFAGDYTTGLGRIHLALACGQRAAEAMLRSL